MNAIRPLVAGNWKMHGLSADLSEVRSLLDLLAAGPRPETDVMVCPPATLLFQTAVVLSGSTVALGAQDCHPEAQGAHTGDLSAPDPYVALPLLMGATMIAQFALTSTTADPVQKKINYIMPIIFILFMKSAPAGLVLYWMVSNLVGVAQQFVINRLNPAPVNLQPR